MEARPAPAPRGSVMPTMEAPGKCRLEAPARARRSWGFRVQTQTAAQTDEEITEISVSRLATPTDEALPEGKEKSEPGLYTFALANFYRSDMLHYFLILSMIRRIFEHGVTDYSSWSLCSQAHFNSPIFLHPTHSDEFGQRRITW